MFRRLAITAVALATLGFIAGRSTVDTAPPAPPASGASARLEGVAADDGVPRGSAQPWLRERVIAVGSGPRATALTTAAFPPLPPPDVPLAGILPELERRARGGDASASCRIGLELLRCRRRAYLRTHERLQTERLARMPSETPEQKKMLEDQIQAAARAREAAARDDAVCTGIDTRSSHDAFDWILRAAQLGNAEARLQMLQQLPLDADRMIVDAERLIAYREAAPGLAAAALAAGDPRVLRTLAHAHYDAPTDAPRVYSPSGLRHLVPADNRRALAYWILARRFAPFPQEQELAVRRAQVEHGYVDPETRVRAELGPEGIAAAEALAAQIERAHFAATRPLPPGQPVSPSPAQCGPS